MFFKNDVWNCSLVVPFDNEILINTDGMKIRELTEREREREREREISMDIDRDNSTRETVWNSHTKKYLSTPPHVRTEKLKNLPIVLL